MDAFARADRTAEFSPLIAVPESHTVRYVTLAYGDAPGVYRQSLMLLLSLVAHAPEPYELVVATDRPECYVWFGTRVEIEYPRRTAARRPGADPTRSRCARSSSLLQRRRGRSDGSIVLLDADVLAAANLSPFVERSAPASSSCTSGSTVRSQSRAAATASYGIASRPIVRSVAGRPRTMRCGIPACSRCRPPIARSLDEALELYDTLGAAGVRHFATEQLVEGVWSSAAPAGSSRPRPGSPTIGATSPATTPRSPAAWPTRSSRGCRSRKPPPATASGRSTCRSKYGGPALKSCVAGWGAARGLSTLNKDHLVGGASRLAALLLP